MSWSTGKRNCNIIYWQLIKRICDQYKSELSSKCKALNFVTNDAANMNHLKNHLNLDSEEITKKHNCLRLFITCFKAASAWHSKIVEYEQMLLSMSYQLYFRDNQILYSFYRETSGQHSSMPSKVRLNIHWGVLKP